jgi:type I restriction enzyme, R subunit
MSWELETVEKPFVEQLQGLGRGHIQGCIDDPAKTGRKSFAEVLQEDVLREQLRKLNLREGKPWLDEARIAEAVAALTRIGAARLMEANQTATEHLLLGVTVDGLPDWDGGRGQTIRFIDWDNPHNNSFTVINQYRVDCPPGYDSGKAFIIPDVVLLVNGLPLVVVECKSPSVTDPLAEAVDQLRRYSNQRRANFEVEENEGNEALFHTNQFLIATSFDAARVGCIGAMFEHFTRWKTVVGPDGMGSEAETAAQLGKSSLSEQERLIAGMLEPARLLDLIRPHPVHPNRRADGEADLPLSAIPRREQGHPTLADRQDPRSRRRTRPARRHHLAHPRFGKKPDLGVSGEKTAHPVRLAPLQGGGGDRPQGLADPVFRHGFIH